MAIVQSNMYDDNKFLVMDTLDVIIDGDDKGNTLEMATLIAEQYVVFCQPDRDVIVVSQQFDGKMMYLVQLDEIDKQDVLSVPNHQEFIEYLNAVNVDLF